MHIFRAMATSMTSALVVSLACAIPGAAAAPHSAGLAPSGTNLIVNGGAEAGSPSQSGYDAVTIPGWSISAGLPTEVLYRGVPGSMVSSPFPGVYSPGPPSRGDAFFSGGAGGTSVLSQLVRLDPVTGSVKFQLSAWLGGSGSNRASSTFSVVFRNHNERVLGTTTIGPVTRTDRDDATGFRDVSTTGVVPTGAVEAEVVLSMVTPSTSYDLEQNSILGYNYAYADDLGLRLSAPEPRAVLIPPKAAVPHYQHVFLVMMENESYADVIGNVAQAPFINSLLRQGAVLTNMYAEVHPSDPNYLALSAGTTFGQLTNPLESDPSFSIPARSIADLVQGSGQTWRGYAQSADGPCDATTHGYYYPDDLPFLYYRDIRDNLARCREHVVPQSYLPGDLTHASTTPNFAWIDANDYFDMEAGGVPAGDQWLHQLVDQIRRSPAWQDQASLLIITWDEDHWEGQRPAQRIPTIVLGSRSVRAGYASTARYDHYSLLRTIEAALGLGSLTGNDRFASPVNDVFANRPSP